MATTPETADNRSASQIMRQWQQLQTVKKQLITQGVLNGDANVEQILDALRAQMPAQLFDRPGL